MIISYFPFFCCIRKLQHPSQKSKEMRMTDVESEPVKDSSARYSDNSKSSGTENIYLNLCHTHYSFTHTHFVNINMNPKWTFPCICFFFQDAHESDSDRDNHAEDNPAQEVCKTHREAKSEPKVCVTGRTVQTAARTRREMDPSPSCGITTLTDGAGCCEPRGSEKERLCRSCSDFSHSCDFPPELHKRLLDPSISNGLLQAAQVNTWSSCANMDRAVPCTLSLAAPVRTPGTAGFHISLQQHPLVKLHRRPSNQQHLNTYRTHRFISRPKLL